MTGTHDRTHRRTPSWGRYLGFASRRAVPYLVAFFLLGVLIGSILARQGIDTFQSQLYGEHTPAWGQHPSAYPISAVEVADELDVPLTLEARLKHFWLNRPALSHANANYASRHGCPSGTYGRDESWFHLEKPAGWKGVGPEDIQRYRSALVEYLRSVEEAGDKVVWESGMDDGGSPDLRRGIIMSAGEGKGLDRALSSIRILRTIFKSSLPVEIYHFPDELQDGVLKKSLSDQFNIQFVEVGGRNGNTQKSWNIKNVALLTTKFLEVMWLDNDNFPLVDPAELFDSVEYQRSGSVFWPDWYKDHPDNAIWRILGRECSDRHWAAETGQLIFDKRANNGLNLAVLHIANHMMSRDDLYGSLSYGDKDTFRYAFYALGLPYQQATRAVAVVGYQETSGSDWDFRGQSFLHWSLTPTSAWGDPEYHHKPAFLHTTLLKGTTGPQAEKMLTHVRHARLDGLDDPRLVRVQYSFEYPLYRMALQGPDGTLEENGVPGDGQALVTLPLRSIISEELWTAIIDSLHSHFGPNN